MPIRSKIEPAKVSASEWQNPGQALRGLLEGKDLHTNITLIRYVTDVVGEGPGKFGIRKFGGRKSARPRVFGRASPIDVRVRRGAAGKFGIRNGEGGYGAVQARGASKWIGG